MSGFWSFLKSFGLLIARLGLGGILLLHGWLRWNAGVQTQIDYLTQFRTPYAEVAAWGAIIFELVGGVLLIVGALTRLVGLGVLIGANLDHLLHELVQVAADFAEPRWHVQGRL